MTSDPSSHHHKLASANNTPDPQLNNASKHHCRVSSRARNATNTQTNTPSTWNQLIPSTIPHVSHKRHNDKHMQTQPAHSQWQQSHPNQETTSSGSGAPKHASRSRSPMSKRPHAHIHSPSHTNWQHNADPHSIAEHSNSTQSVHTRKVSDCGKMHLLALIDGHDLKLHALPQVCCFHVLPPIAQDMFEQKYAKLHLQSTCLICKSLLLADKQVAAGCWLQNVPVH